MATTTTFAAIRDSFYTTIEAVAPAIARRGETGAGDYRRCPDRRSLIRDWAALNATDACFRTFEMRVTGPRELLSFHADDAIELNVQATFTICYPVNVSLYGNDLDEMEDLIESDAHKLYDALRSPDNYVAGCSVADVQIQAPERGADVWFQDITVQLIYTASSTL